MITQRLSYTVEEACGATGFCRSRLYQAIADRSLATFKAGRRRMVSAKALEQFIANLERASARKSA